MAAGKGGVLAWWRGVWVVTGRAMHQPTALHFQAPKAVSWI